MRQSAHSSCRPLQEAPVPTCSHSQPLPGSRQPVICFLSAQDFAFSERFMETDSNSMWMLVFCTWLPELSIGFGRSVRVVGVTSAPSSLLLRNMPLCGQTPFFLPVHRWRTFGLFSPCACYGGAAVNRACFSSRGRKQEWPCWVACRFTFNFLRDD